MAAWLRAKKLWRIVNGYSTIPDITAGATQAQIDDWEEKCDQAAGEIYLMVSKPIRVHIDAVKDDPVKMWSALKGAFVIQRPGARFNAYDDLFIIRKVLEESLTSLAGRVDEVVQKIQNLRPSDFTIDTLVDELRSMALIRALPD